MVETRSPIPSALASALVPGKRRRRGFRGGRAMERRLEVSLARSALPAIRIAGRAATRPLGVAGREVGLAWPLLAPPAGGVERARASSISLPPQTRRTLIRLICGSPGLLRLGAIRANDLVRSGRGWTVRRAFSRSAAAWPPGATSISGSTTLPFLAAAVFPVAYRPPRLPRIRPVSF